MIASSFFVLVSILLNERGLVQAFTSNIKAASPLAAYRLPNRAQLELRAIVPSEEPCDSVRNSRVLKRRNFLAKFASVSLFPILAISPSPVSARGFNTIENGPLVYGDDSIMSPKEHGKMLVRCEHSR